MSNVLEVVKAVGFAVWQIQVLESTAATYLVLVHQVPPQAAREDVEALLAGAKGKTLGQIQRALAGRDRAPVELIGELEGSLPANISETPDFE